MHRRACLTLIGPFAAALAARARLSALQATSGLPRPPHHNVDEEVRQVERDRFAAMLNGDLAALDRLLAAELSHRHGDGRVVDKGGIHRRPEDWRLQPGRRKGDEHVFATRSHDRGVSFDRRLERRCAQRTVHELARRHRYRSERSRIPKATLTLVNNDTGIRSGVVASDTGYYRFPALAASTFTLTVTAPGFRTVTMSDLRLEVGERRTVNVTLEVSPEVATVNVTATPAAVELSEARMSGVIATKDVTDLPIVGRNLINLLSLTGGVTGTPPGLGSSSSQSGNDVFNAEPNVSMNASGNRSEQNGFAVDSGTTTSMVRHGVVNLQPNAESIQEVRITVNNFSAEQGSDAGASVNALTKQGTNAFRGSLAYWHSSDALQARNVFQRSVPVFRRNEEAGSLGGPIFKNRTFFFGSFDILRAAETPGSTVTVETPAFASPLDVMATLSQDRKILTVSVINPSETSRQLELQVEGAALPDSARKWTIAGPSIKAQNVVGDKPMIELVESAVSDATRSQTIPPTSITLYAFQLSKASSSAADARR